MVMTVGRSKGTLNGVVRWLPLPGCPVSGLASANTTMSGEEFLDSEDEDWDLLRSIFLCGEKDREDEGDCWYVCLNPASFLSFTSLPS